MTMRPGSPHPDDYPNATPVFTGRDCIRSLNQPRDRNLQHHKNTLAGWIAVIADDRGLGPNDVAGLVGLDRELAAAILEGAVMTVPLSVLDRTLLTLENRPH